MRADVSGSVEQPLLTQPAMLVPKQQQHSSHHHTRFNNIIYYIKIYINYNTVYIQTSQCDECKCTSDVVVLVVVGNDFRSYVLFRLNLVKVQNHVWNGAGKHQPSINHPRFPEVSDPGMQQSDLTCLPQCRCLFHG